MPKMILSNWRGPGWLEERRQWRSGYCPNTARACARLRERSASRAIRCAATCGSRTQRGIANGHPSLASYQRSRATSSSAWPLHCRIGWRPRCCCVNCARGATRLWGGTDGWRPRRLHPRLCGGLGEMEPSGARQRYPPRLTAARHIHAFGASAKGDGRQAAKFRKCARAWWRCLVASPPCRQGRDAEVSPRASASPGSRQSSRR